MVPLPDDDRACFHEAMLLSLALVGSLPGALESRLLLAGELERLGIGQQSIHVRHRGDRKFLYEEWISIRPDGSGRHHGSAPPESESWPTVEIDHARRPGHERLAALARRAHLLPAADRSVRDGLDFLRNALEVTAPGAVSPLRTALRDLGLSLRLPETIGAGPDAVSVVAHETDRIRGLLRVGRERGSVDGLTASEVIIGTELSMAIARAAGKDGLSRWVQYTTFFLLQVGEREPTIGPVLAKAVREGFAPVISELSRLLLEEGDRMQERALDLSPPSRVRFAKLLYDGYPTLLAARQLARSLVDLLPSSPEAPVWSRRLTVADERSVRFIDGMIEQWADLGESRLRGERAELAQATAAGDKRRVRTIIVSGEEALRRPRSVRQYLLDVSADRDE